MLMYLVVARPAERLQCVVDVVHHGWSIHAPVACQERQILHGGRLSCSMCAASGRQQDDDEGGAVTEGMNFQHVSGKFRSGQGDSVKYLNRTQLEIIVRRCFVLRRNGGVRAWGYTGHFNADIGNPAHREAVAALDPATGGRGVGTEKGTATAEPEIAKAVND